MRRFALSRPSAFSLVEILVATTIFGMVSAGVLGVFIQVLSIYRYDTGKLLVNKDLRKFTGEMTENATYANYFRIFPSYSSISRTVDVLVNPSVGPEGGWTTAITDTAVTDGSSGDCLVLVYKDPADDRKIARLIIYMRVPGASNPTPAAGGKTFNRGAVHKLDFRITPSSLLPIYQLIPEITNPTQYPVVLQSVGVLSPTLALVPDSSPPVLQSWGLFYNYYNRSIIFKGELIHTGSQINVKNATATNTYNFTVSPRG
jgi:prepilin-type N-terminal cleavage/methylation domain-containing protein